ncbi:LysR family transcriptional regulator [Limibaculum sp. FT325]|uniref:LysR family transcriptional regulator n=1 Tax=Thermohalobaculum sediminis TaxID=2939436 RepID=UPI0020C0F697|nr:LysR family transcriptional regulator [Limibaculum sediminis]MCL5778239.1 LysR family transcriptional regulator [Limibaculum sediminis]
MRDLTLRQIEVIRAVMMTGTIAGAAALLNVSAPGISRLLKHTEASLGVRLFERKAGLFIPATEAARVFEQVHQVYEKVENLSFVVGNLRRGRDAGLAFASVPSIAQFIASRALRRVRSRFPELYIDLNILTIEDAVDYLLLERGEFVAMSYAVENPALDCHLLARGEVVAILPHNHPLAGRQSISVHDIADEPLIGVDPSDPYGAIVARPFRDAGIEPRHAIRGRFAQTVVSLVRHGLGVALIDEFSVAEVYMPGLVRVRLSETVEVSAFAMQKRGRVLSSFAEHAIEALRHELSAAVRSRPWERAGAPGH